MIIIRITLNKEMISNFFDEKANNFNTQLKYTDEKNEKWISYISKMEKDIKFIQMVLRSRGV